MNQTTKALLAVLLMSVLWGYGWVALKIGLLDAQPFDFNALRLGLSGLCLLAMLRLTGRPIRPRRVPELLALGCVQTATLFTLSGWAVALGTPGRVAFLVYTMPFFTLLFAWPLLGERIHGRQWLPVGLAGTGLIAIIQPWALQSSLLGNGLALAAGATWALGAIMTKRLQRRGAMDILTMTAWQMVFGSGPLILLACVVPEAPITWSPRFIGILLLVTVVITAVGWFLWMYALDNLSAGTAGLATLGAPPIAMLASYLQLGERPAALEAFGMALIVAALVLLGTVTGHNERAVGGARTDE